MSDGFVDKENLPSLPSVSSKPKASGPKVRGRLGLGLGLGRPQRVDTAVLADVTDATANAEAGSIQFVPDALAPPSKPLGGHLPSGAMGGSGTLGGAPLPSADATPLSPTPTPLPKATRTRAAAGGGLLARLNQTLPPPAASPASLAGHGHGHGHGTRSGVPGLADDNGPYSGIAPAGGPALSWTSSNSSSGPTSAGSSSTVPGGVAGEADVEPEVDALSPLPQAVARRGARRAAPAPAQAPAPAPAATAAAAAPERAVPGGSYLSLPQPSALPVAASGFSSSEAEAATPLVPRRIPGSAFGVGGSRSGNGGRGNVSAHSPLPAVPAIITLGSSSSSAAAAGSKSSSSARPSSSHVSTHTLTPAHAHAPIVAPASAPASASASAAAAGTGAHSHAFIADSRLPLSSSSAPATASAAASAAAAAAVSAGNVGSLRSLVSPISSADIPLFPNASSAGAGSGSVSTGGSKSGPFKTPHTPTRTHGHAYGQSLPPVPATTASAAAAATSAAAAATAAATAAGSNDVTGSAAAPARVSLRHLVSIRSSSTSAAPSSAPTPAPAPAPAAAPAAAGTVRERRQLRPIVAPVRAPAPVPASLAPGPAPAPADAAAAAAAAAAASIAAGGTGEVIHVNAVPYAVAQEVGVGGSARVYRVLTPEGRELALKKISLSPECKGHVANYEEEIRLLQKLRNQPHVIQLIDTEVADENTILMLFEFGRMDMAQVLKHPTKAPSVKGLQPATGEKGKVIGLGWEQVRFFWREFLMCVDMCHENGIIHLDLKPSNFVLVGDQLKIIDFGIAKEIDDDATSVVRESPVGTLNYMSPESILGMMTGTDPSSQPQYKLNRSADIWALGCMLYQMIFGKAPFAHVRSELRLSAITNPQVPIDIPSLPAHLAAAASESDVTAVTDALLRCLERDPKKRATLPELLGHPYVLGTSAGAAGSASGGSLRPVTSYALCVAMNKAVPSTAGEEMEPKGVDAVARRVLGGLSPEDRADLAAWLRDKLADVMYPPPPPAGRK